MDNKNGLSKKYGLWTAIAMVVGIVVGSGVFFKGQDVLAYTGGNMWLGILAWIIGGTVMLICACTFSNMATKYEKTNGVVDYAEATCGKRYAYYVGWFLSTIYFPTLTSVLAWVSARYICSLVGFSITGAECMILAGFLLVGSFVLNALAPRISGKVQVSTTVIKLIPLGLMVIVGTIYGLVTGVTFENFAYAANSAFGGGSLFKGIVATAFAYEGWIIATSINSEIKNSKRNLPKALLFGSIIVVSIYILYFIGVAGCVDVETLISEGVFTAFTTIFGNVGGLILNLFVVVSCLGTLNGLTMGATRSMYSLSVRNQGINPKMFKKVDETTEMPVNSCFIGLFLSFFWLVYFYGANLTNSWFGVFSFDSSELPIITIYGMYVPIFIMWMIKEKDEKPFKRFVLPIFALIACVFMMFCAVMGHGVYKFQEAQSVGQFAFPVLFYLIVYGVVMFIGFLFELRNRKIQNESVEESVETEKQEEV